MSETSCGSQAPSVPLSRYRGDGMSDKKAFQPDDYLENADWTKGHGPQDLGIGTRAQLVAYLSRNHMTLREFAKLPVFYRSKDEWQRILEK